MKKYIRTKFDLKIFGLSMNAETDDSKFIGRTVAISIFMLACGIASFLILHAIAPNGLIH